MGTGRRLRGWNTEIAVVGMLVGCGGGADPVSPPGPPPPPPPATLGLPATITIQVGDGQQADPGSVVPVKPMVLVRDGAGRALPGVAVTFVVDSGGGSIQSAAATTATDGTAGPGDWTLGPSEGRNVMSVVAGSLSTRVVASARYISAEVANQTISAGGGQIALGGSGPLAGFALTVPSGAYSGGVNVRVGYGSAEGVPHDTIARFASPLVTIESDAPGVAGDLLTLRIPARIEPGEFPLVTFVDPATGFLSALPTIDFDATSVTAEAPALTDRPLLPLDVLPATRMANAGLPLGPAATKVSVVVQAIKYNINLLPTVTGFKPGTDDWEFADQPTSLGLTGLGQVASERYYYLKRKAEGPLWERFQQAKGVQTSNSAGLYWTAGLHAVILPTLQKHFKASAARHTADPRKYDSLAVRHTVLSMILSGGEPQVAVMLDPATYRLHAGLIYGWSGPLGRQLLVADPGKPGDPTVREGLTNGTLACAAPIVGCVMTVGLNYISNGLDPQWPLVLDATKYKAWFPPAFVGKNLPGSVAWPPPGAPPGAIDTIYFSRDTGSVYTLIPSWPHQLPTGLANPSTVLRTQAWIENSPGSWSASTSGSSNNLEFLDVANLRTSPTDPGVDRLFAVEARVVWPPAPGKVTEGWNGFKLYRLIKYVPKLTGMYAVPGQRTDFTISTAGGPPLPANFVRYVDFDDGTTSTWQHSANTTSNFYSDSRTRTVRFALIHPDTRDTVARASIKLEALTLTPNPLNGDSDTDYTFTATYGQPLPPNASWVWNPDDGRTLTTPGNITTIRWPPDFAKFNHTYALTVKLMSGSTVVATATSDVTIRTHITAWAFTYVNVQFSTVERSPGDGANAHQSICYQCWSADSLMLVRLRDGQAQGGLLHLPQDYTFPGTGLGPVLGLHGIYLLEGSNITLARVQSDLDFFGVAFTSAAPAPGRIKNQWLVYPSGANPSPPTTDGNYLKSWSAAGTVGNGSLTGTAWGPTQPFNGNTVFFPLNLRQASVTFNGDVATGTLTYIYRLFAAVTGGQIVERWRAVGTLTFTALRLQ